MTRTLFFFFCTPLSGCLIFFFLLSTFLSPQTPLFVCCEGKEVELGGKVRKGKGREGREERKKKMGGGQGNTKGQRDRLARKEREMEKKGLRGKRMRDA